MLSKVYKNAHLSHLSKFRNQNLKNLGLNTRRFRLTGSATSSPNEIGVGVDNAHPLRKSPTTPRTQYHAFPSPFKTHLNPNQNSPLQRIPSSRCYSSSSSSSSSSPKENLPPQTPTYPPSQLLHSLSLTANHPFPPIPPGETTEPEYFWRAYLFASQIIMYLAARPRRDAEVFDTILQTAIVDPTSDIAQGRESILKVTKKIVDTMGSVPTSSSLRKDHPDVFHAFEALRLTYEGSYGRTTRKKDDELVEGQRDEKHELERWTKFFVGLRTELPVFTERIRDVVERWDDEMEMS